MLRYCIALCLWVSMAVTAAGNPVDNLLNRIDPGAARKFKTELVKTERDFFELDQQS